MLSHTAAAQLALQHQLHKARQIWSLTASGELLRHVTVV